MRIVKIVKLQRVRYGDLEEGDRYTTHVHGGRLMDEHICDCSWGFKDALYRPLDTDKYPPEVTYNIEGIPDRMIVETTEEGVFLDTVDLLSGDAQLAPIGDKVEETRYI